MKSVHIFECQPSVNTLPNIVAGKDTPWIFLGYSSAILESLRASTRDTGREIPLGDEISRSAEELRQPFVDYLATITRKTPPEENLYSGLVERVPFRSNVFLDICLIDAAIRMIRSDRADSFIILCEHRGLALDLIQSFQHFKDIRIDSSIRGPTIPIGNWISSSILVPLHAAKIAGQLLYRKLRAARNFPVSPSVEKKENGVIVLHSWIAQASISTGEYRELFFSDLREKLESYGYRILFLPHVPYDISFSEAQAALDRKQIPYLAEEACISVTDILRIFLKTVGNIPRGSEHQLNTIHFSQAAYLQNYQDWQNLQILIPSLCECIISGLRGKDIPPIRTLIFTYENNAWEKAFIKKTRELFPDTTCIGYQHSTVTPNYLYYYLSQSPVDQDIVPDLVITNGEYPSAFLKKHYFPPGRVITGGALRYSSSTDFNTDHTQIQIPAPTRILVTPPGLIDEAVELLEKVFTALERNYDFSVQVKLHPFLSKEKIEQKLPASLNNAINYTTHPIRALLPSVDILIYSTTSTCIEALGQGIPVLKIKSEYRLDFDPLGDFQGSTQFIRTAVQPEDIMSSLYQLKALRPSESDMIQIREIVRSIFGPVSEDTYRQFTRIK